MKQFLGLARVSSREQEREGFSLDVQEDALHADAERKGGVVVKMFRIAETATKSDERKTFKEALAYARKNAAKLDGILFYKVDRAARNLFDYVELERLESEYGVPFISVSQPTENTPAGRMMRRTLANMASFYTEQQSLDVREGLQRRVESGLFVNQAPYGYVNVRRDGRSVVDLHPENAPKVRRIFDLYAYHGHTRDSLMDALATEGIDFSLAKPRFTRSKLYQLLRDRSYIGEVKYNGQWYSGTHGHLVDRPTWDKVQVLLGEKVYRSHELTYASELINCGHCGRPISGEAKTKKTKTGTREYVYYRCARYNKDGHPRVRLTEKELDKQVLGLFDNLRVEDEHLRDWFATALREKSQFEQRESRERVLTLQRQVSSVHQQQDELLNLRLLKEIDEDTYSRKSTELRDRESGLALQLEACSRGRHEYADLAIKAFELSQSLRSRWVTADYATKRTILEIVCLNFTLEGASLVPEWRKPFDVLAKGLPVHQSRGERI